jgi:2-polyprenyl-6-methoxyphenol hydroxylase-like FAD-dependent oxidoreductase
MLQSHRTHAAERPPRARAGQGGCLALEDAVVLARALRKAGAGGAGGSLRSATATEVVQALRGFERERSVRAVRIAVQSWLFGTVLQLPYAPVRRCRCSLALHVTQWSAVAQLFTPLSRLHPAQFKQVFHCAA